MSVKNKTVLITGSTRGIGYAIAEKLAAQGANLILSGTRQEKVDEVVNKLKQSYSTSISGFACNISDYSDCEKLIKEATNLGPVDILINNAGITKDNLLLRMKKEDWCDVIDTNLNSIFFLTKLITRHMLKNKKGKIINISSVVGLIGNPGQSNYAASKAGIIGFTKSVAKELGSKGITCNAIAPGFIETDMINTLPDEYLNNIIQSIPIKRLGKTDDVSNLVLFLSSDDSNYITGQVISVDGGMNM